MVYILLPVFFNTKVGNVSTILKVSKCKHSLHLVGDNYETTR